MTTNITHLNDLILALQNGLKPKFLFFWGHTAGKGGQVGKECLGQWYAAAFVVDRVSYAQGCSKVIYETIKQRESITEELLQAGHNTDDAHQELWDPLDSAE